MGAAGVIPARSGWLSNAFSLHTSAFSLPPSALIFFASRRFSFPKTPLEMSYLLRRAMLSPNQASPSGPQGQTSGFRLA
jgi:hypothetical protein